MFRWGAIAVVVSMTSIAAAADEAALAKVAEGFGPPVMRVARPAAAPRIDGELDDACWAQAAPVVLRYLALQWDVPTARTEARVLADTKAIYFAVKCFESEMDRVIAAGEGRDGALWNGDTVEIFLDPGHKSARLDYYHVVVNPEGLIYDGKGKDGKAWNADVRAAAGRFKGGWTVEAAVPMKDLGVAGAIPKVWGLNVNRQRLELGRPTKHYPLIPSMIRIPDPEKYRIGEDTAWSPTYCESSHVAQRFGHGLLEAGTVDVAPPAKRFEVIYKSDFDDGRVADWWNAKAVGDENFRGSGGCLAPKAGSGAVQFKPALKDLDDVTLIYALKMPADGRFSYYGRAPDNEQCEADRHEVLLTAEAAQARKWVGMDEWSTHASKMAWRPMGKLWTGPGPWKMMTGHFSEPSIGNVMWPGTDWVVVHTRLGMLRRQRSQGLVPMSQNYPRGFTFASGKPYFIDNVVIFRGADVEPPQRVAGVKLDSRAGGKVLSWRPPADNTFALYYAVLADGKRIAETHRLSVALPAGAAGKAVTVVAADLYGNTSEPSAPVTAPN